MKKIYLLFTAISLVWAGCSDTGIDAINEEVNLIELNKNKYEWFNLPLPASSVESSVFIVTEKINGNKGGEIEFEGSYRTLDNRTITIESELEIPGDKQAFKGSKKLTQVFGSEAVVDFYPDMTFDAPLILNLEYEGLDLSGISENNIDFYYIALDGSLQVVEYDELVVDHTDGSLEIKNAKIPHFSRYGWVKKTLE